MIGFVSVRFSDGEPFAAEPLPDVAEDSDIVAEETLEREGGGESTPRAETASAPIDADPLGSARLRSRSLARDANDRRSS